MERIGWEWREAMRRGKVIVLTDEVRFVPFDAATAAAAAAAARARLPCWRRWVAQVEATFRWALVPMPCCGRRIHGSVDERVAHRIRCRARALWKSGVLSLNELRAIEGLPSVSLRDEVEMTAQARTGMRGAELRPSRVIPPPAPWPNPPAGGGL